MRGGNPARAALLLRAAELSDDPAARAVRLLGSGEALLTAGDVTAAKGRLLAAQPELVEPLTRAAATRALGFVEFALGNLVVVPPMLLQAAAQAADTRAATRTHHPVRGDDRCLIGRHHQRDWTLTSVAGAVLGDRAEVDEAHAAGPGRRRLWPPD